MNRRKLYAIPTKHSDRIKSVSDSDTEESAYEEDAYSESSDSECEKKPSPNFRKRGLKLSPSGPDSLDDASDLTEEDGRRRRIKRRKFDFATVFPCDTYSANPAVHEVKRCLRKFNEKKDEIEESYIDELISQLNNFDLKQGEYENDDGEFPNMTLKEKVEVVKADLERIFMDNEKERSKFLDSFDVNPYLEKLLYRGSDINLSAYQMGLYKVVHGESLKSHNADVIDIVMWTSKPVKKLVHCPASVAERPEIESMALGVIAETAEGVTQEYTKVFLEFAEAKYNFLYGRSQPTEQQAY